MCPYPYGTEAYFLWWDIKNKEEIKHYLAAQEVVKKKPVNFGHNFDLRDMVCLNCGMDLLSFAFHEVPCRPVDYQI